MNASAPATKDDCRPAVEAHYGQPLTDDQWADVDIYFGSLADYAHNEADELSYLANEFISRYFDAEQFAYDLWLGGDVVALFTYGDRDREAVNVSFGVWWTNPNEF